MGGGGVVGTVSQAHDYVGWGCFTDCLGVVYRLFRGVFLWVVLWVLRLFLGCWNYFRLDIERGVFAIVLQGGY